VPSNRLAKLDSNPLAGNRRPANYYLGRSGSWPMAAQRSVTEQDARVTGTNKTPSIQSTETKKAKRRLRLL